MSYLRSLWNVMRKELAQTLRDRQMVFTLLVAPLIQLVAAGYAVGVTLDHIPTVICDEDDTHASRDLVDAFFANASFKRQDQVANPEAANAMLESGGAAVALIVPRGFALRLARRDDPEVQVLVDGTDPIRAQVAVSHASQFLQRHGLDAPTLRPGRSGPTLVPRILYNPRLSNAVYMVPGSVTIFLLNITLLMTAMGLTREKEDGTLEQVLVTPIRPSILLAGKSMSFLLFGAVDVVAMLVVGSLVFAVPLNGSFAVIGLGAFLYLISTLGIGILIATASSSQTQAIMGAFAFFLPALLMSGFLSPIESMPRWLQPVTLLNPLRHFNEIMRGCLLKAATAADLARQLIALALIGAVAIVVSIKHFHKRSA